MIKEPSQQNGNDDTMGKIEFLFDVIRRYDTYILSTNAKASLIIAFNSLILGTILMRFGEIITFYSCLESKLLVGFLLILITISSLVSLFYVFEVVYPYLDDITDKTNKNNSLIYFGSVSKMSSSEYLDQIEKSSQQDIINDLAGQAVILSKGLNKKMTQMRKSIGWISFNLVIVFFLVVFRTLQTGGQ